MSSYFPPEKTLAIFDPSVFKKNTDALTIQEADTRYCRFSTAQGTMNFTNINVFGDASFNQDVSVAGTLTAGTFSIGNITVNSMDVGTGGIDCSGNLVLADYTPISTTTELFVMAQANNNNRVGFILNPGIGAYNFITQANDNLLAFGEIGGPSTSLVIAPWSTTSNGIRMTQTETMMGSGGTGQSPTHRLNTDATQFRITSSNFQVDGNMTLINANSANRQITASYINVSDITANLTGLQLYQNTSSTIFDNNASTNGVFTFACNDSAGVQQIPLQLFSTLVECNKNLLINGVGNYLQFPDGTQQTTAYSVAGNQKTYSTEYTSSTSFNLPTNVIGIGVRCVGRGGNAGNCSDGNGGTWASGGTGGGASSVYSNGIIPLIQGQNIVITIDNTASTGSVIFSTNSVQLCKAFNGNNGGNASGSGTAGIGASAQLNGTGNTNFSTWTVLAGNAGISGIPNNSFQSVAGVPTISSTSYTSSPPYLPFSDTGRGCGQRYSASGGANCFPTSSGNPQGGICIITYYLK